jgi:hypothetical protein
MAERPRGGPGAGAPLMATYYEKLKDPRWQRRRLEVLSRASWACESCGAKDRTLHVHHRIYRRGANPWDYADADLQSLCESCHETTEQWRGKLNEAIAGLADWELRTLVGFADGMGVRSSGKSCAVRGFDHAVGILLATVGANTENGRLSRLATRLSEIGSLSQTDTDWLGEFEVKWIDDEPTKGAENDG